MLSREQRIRKIEQDPGVSVLIVGAGINGIGVFRDLAMQGVDVIMIDKGDYCSGASAASSHMAHGGIRYLENGEFRLVREAVQERNRLIENAPHLVRPLPTTFPIFRWFSGMFNAPLKFLGLLDRPSERGAVVLKIGMSLYDLYTRRQRTVPPHKFWRKQVSLDHFPELSREIIGTGTYFDGAMLSPERIAIELILDAVAANQDAVPLSYFQAESTHQDEVVLRDRLTGKQVSVRPRIVVNAGGPWIDRVNEALGEPTTYIGGTKGSHIVLENTRLRQAIGDHEFFFENKDGRMVLIFPLGDRILIGTSDLRADNPDDVSITQDEVRYFFDMLKRVFPAIEVDESQIVFTFSGVRPLGRSGSTNTGQISRDHKVEEYAIAGESRIPVFSLVGGKWTTFRALAEVATDQVLGRLNKLRAVSTKQVKIGGGKEFPRSADQREEWVRLHASATGLPETRLEQLLGRYGTRAAPMSTYLAAGDDRALTHYPDYSLREIAYVVREEDVNHLDDFILRRSLVGMLGRATSSGLREIGQAIGQELRWGDDDFENEIYRTLQILRTKHKMDPETFISD